MPDYSFNESGVKRIVASVRKTEGQTISNRTSTERGQPLENIPNMYVRTTGTIADHGKGTATILTAQAAGSVVSWATTTGTLEIVNETGATIASGSDVLCDWETQSGFYVVWSAGSAPTLRAQMFYCNAAHASALTITASGSYNTIPFDAYEGDNFISLSSNVMTTDTAGTYWVGLTPAWALGNSAISSGNNHVVLWNYLDKSTDGGSNWNAVPGGFNISNLVCITTINHVDTSTGNPDNWQSLEMPWKAGSSFAVAANAGDKFRVRAAIVGYTYSRTSPGTLKAVCITGAGSNYIQPYQISWYLVS